MAFGFLLGLLFLWLSIFYFIKHIQLRQDCLPIDGKIISYIITTDYDTRTGKTIKIYFPVIQFQGFDGQNYILTSIMGSSKIDCQVGALVKLLVGRTNPLKATVDTLQIFVKLAIFGVVGILAMIITYKQTSFFAICVAAGLIMTCHYAFKSISRRRFEKQFKLVNPGKPIPPFDDGFKSVVSEVYPEKDAPHERWAEFLLGQNKKAN